MAEILRCCTQSYAWGRKGSSSEVGRLKRASDADFELDNEKPYAELWMGTHSSGPSYVSQSNFLLSEFLKDKPHLVGIVPSGYPTNDLPFLFKVLSVQTALSIQSHPDKAFAPILHANFPEHYKDPNHKPEMVVAVTPFEAMCGFRSIEQIRENVVLHPELKDLIGEEAYTELKDSKDKLMSEEDNRALMKRIFCSYMTCNDATAAAAISAIVERFAGTLITDEEYAIESASASDGPSAQDIMKLILRLHADYPGDRGIFAPLLLNVIYLKPGQSFFMGPNEPHAYLFGDCVECMALSDNVVRAGLTPKFKHVDVLCGMLHYKCGAPDLIEPFNIDARTTRLRPDPNVCSEFELDVTTLTGTADASNPVEYSFAPLPCGSLLLLLRGRSVSYRCDSESEFSSIDEGSVIFLGANQSLVISCDVEADEEITVFRAHVNLGSF